MPETPIPFLINSMQTLETERLRLRRLTKKDAQDMYEYASKPEVSRFLLWSPHESLRYTKKFIKLLLTKYKSGEYLDWGIELKAEGKLIGTCGFASIDIENAKGEIGYVISDSYWSKGYGLEAVKRVIEYSFTELGINRLEARVMEGNEASERLLKKCGMTHEGFFKQELLVKGEYKSINHFAICKCDYFK